MFMRVSDVDTALRAYQEYCSGSLPKPLLLTPNLDIPAPLINKTDPECDADVHVSVSPHLLFVKQGEELKRLTRIVDDDQAEETAGTFSVTSEGADSDYGSDGMNWTDPKYIEALDEAENRPI